MNINPQKCIYIVIVLSDVNEIVPGYLNEQYPVITNTHKNCRCIRKHKN